MGNPLVTILTPVYNHENYLDDYFQSIINQTYDNIELVIIDDASTDNSKKVINKWKNKLDERFKRFVFINRYDNKGLIINCNEGLQVAEGKYIHLFASDDVMFPNNIEKKVKYLEKHSELAFVHSACISGMNLDDKSNNIIGLNGDSGYVFYKLLKGNFIKAPTVLVRKEILIEVGGYNEKWVYEDYPMWLEITSRYPIGFINEPLVFYRTSPNSMIRSTKSFTKIIDNQAIILKEWSKKIGVDITESLDILYSSAASYLFDKDKSKFDEYRKLISKKIDFSNFDKLKRPIYLWGTGSTSERYYHLLTAHNVQIKGFIDSETSKLNSTYLGLKVFNIHQIAGEKPFVIISSSYFEEISEQLEELGFKENKDFISYF